MSEAIEEIARDIYYDKNIENYIKETTMKIMRTLNSSLNEEFQMDK